MEKDNEILIQAGQVVEQYIARESDQVWSAIIGCEAMIEIYKKENNQRLLSQAKKTKKDLQKKLSQLSEWD